MPLFNSGAKFKLERRQMQSFQADVTSRSIDKTMTSSLPKAHNVIGGQKAKQDPLPSSHLINGGVGDNAVNIALVPILRLKPQPVSLIWGRL